MVSVQTLTQTPMWQVRGFNLIARQLGRAFMSTTWGVGFLPLLRNKLVLAFETT